MGYRIASFNMKNFSLSTEKDLNRIAAIIKEGAFDIVAMQEVLAEGRAISGVRVQNKLNQKTAIEKSLIRRLGQDWDSFWGDPKTSSKFYPYLGQDNRGEGYAFLWNTKKFELINVPNNPRIFRDYKTNYGNGAHRLIRDPLYGRFKIKGTKIEIRLITTHIVYGKPKENNLNISFDGGAVAIRKHEFDVLAGSIYNRISSYRKDAEPTVPYTLILGDYNLNLKSSEIGTAILNDVTYFSPDGRPLTKYEQGCEIIYTVQKEKTTLDKNGYANNFDHFSFDDKTGSVVTQCERIDAVHKNKHPEDKSEQDLFERFYNGVSDHVPVVIELNFR